MHYPPTGNRRPSGLRRSGISLAVAALLIALTPQSLALDKSGVRSSVISVPSGPGSIQGLGETFDPDLVTGTGRYAVEINVPPGVAGFEPNLFLRYDGGNGNGVLGFGWELYQGYVQRKTSLGVPRYIDADNQVDDDGDGVVDEAAEIDVFVTSMTDDLIPDLQGGAVALEDAYYFSRTEGAFLRYQRVDDHWEAQSKKGVRFIYGKNSTAQVRDEASGRVFRWLLEQRIDPHGNTIRYQYRSFSGDNNQNQVYLDSVSYGPGAPPWDAFHFVKINYESRSDWNEDCRAGFPVRTGMRVKEIVVCTQGVPLDGHTTGDWNEDGLPDSLNRLYACSYATDGFWSQLDQVILTGCREDSDSRVISFSYTQADVTPDQALEVIAASGMPAHLMDKDWVDFNDMNGDGAPDILSTDPTGAGPHRVYLNLGESHQDDQPVVSWGPGLEVGGDSLAWNVSLAAEKSSVAHLADMDGDGLSDLVYRTGIDAYYFANTPGSLSAWGERQKLNVGLEAEAPPSPFAVEHVETTDMDGDKRVDIIQSIRVGDGAYYRIWFNRGAQGFSEGKTFPQDYGFMLSDPGVCIADINGDGLSDIVRVRPSGLWVTASLGQGAFAALEEVYLPDATLQEQWIERAAFADLNGDGLEDLVLERAVPGELWVWMNQGNYTFQERLVFEGLPVAYGQDPTVRWADINGNDTIDLVYADSNDTEAPLRAVDIGRHLGVEPKAHLLTSIDNGLGGITRIEYATSTQQAQQDAVEGSPWTNPLPFPVHVISASEVDDSNGHVYRAEIFHHEGYYDLTERQFRGFERTERWVLGDEGEEAVSPTCVTCYHFDVGRSLWAMKGRLIEQSVAQAPEDGGGIFHKTGYTWDHYTVIEGDESDEQARRPSVFCFPSVREKTFYELGVADPKTIRFEYEYDHYGNRIVERQYAEVVSDPPEVIRTLYSDYINDTDQWMLGFLTREELHTTYDNIQQRAEYYYDDPTFDRGNYGQISFGDITMSGQYADTSDPDSWVAENRIQYDSYGNGVVYLDGMAQVNAGVPDPSVGHYHTVAYDPDFKTWPILETLYVGAGRANLRCSAVYDRGLGLITSKTNYNGHETLYAYNALGYFSRLIRPGDSAAYPTVEYDYVVAQQSATNKTINYIETRLLDKAPGTQATLRDHYFISRSYINGLGRTLQQKEEAEPDSTTGLPRVAVDGAKYMTKRGMVKATFPAFYSAISGASLDDLLDFEDVEASNWRGWFHLAPESAKSEENLQLLSLEEAPKKQFRYDALRRRIERKQADGSRYQTRFSPFMVTKYDPEDLNPESTHYNTPIYYSWDGLGRLRTIQEDVRLDDKGESTTEITQWITTFNYRLDDLLTATIDAQGNKALYAYDHMARLTQRNDPDRGLFNYSYDDASNLIETTDARGQRITQTYDGLNRILSEDFHDEQAPWSAQRVYDPSRPMAPGNMPDVAYFYDSPAGEVDFGNGDSGVAENSQGYLSRIVDLAGEKHISYDARGRRAWVLRIQPDPYTDLPVHYYSTLSYDSADRLTAMTFPDGDRVSYSYNDRRMLESIHGGARMNAASAPWILKECNYAPSSKVLNMSYGNGVNSAYAYDNRGRLAYLSSALPDEDPLLHYRYSFNAVSCIEQVDDLRPSSSYPTGDPRRNSQRFAYDDLYRLNRVDYSFQAPDQDATWQDGYVRYFMNRIGNVVRRISNNKELRDAVPVVDTGDMAYGGEAGQWSRQGRNPGEDPGPHAITAAGSGDGLRSFDYDDNGNMIGLRGMQFTYDFKDRLIIAESEETRSEYTYYYSGKRALKKVYYKNDGVGDAATPDSVVRYINKYFEIRDHDQAVKYVYNGPMRLARITGTLDESRDRVQRVRLFEGWNLISIMVDAQDAADQLGVGSDPDLEALFLWNAAAESFKAWAAGDALGQGDIFWIYAAKAKALSLRGAYDGPQKTSASLTGAGQYVAPGGLEMLNLDTAIPWQIDKTFSFDAANQAWTSRLAENWAFLSNAPAFIGPGVVVYVSLYDQASIETPPPQQHIAYYLSDHLNSSNLIVDGAAAVLKEETYYPFGASRYRYDAQEAEGILPCVYGYNQKEHDVETGLDYFGARYLESTLCRFLNVDPLHRGRGVGPVRDSQVLNAYALSRNNPIQYFDPDGRMFKRASFGSVGVSVRGAAVRTTARSYLGATSRYALGIGVGTSTVGSGAAGHARPPVSGAASARTLSPMSTAYAGMFSNAGDIAGSLMTSAIRQAEGALGKMITASFAGVDGGKKKKGEEEEEEEGGGEEEEEDDEDEDEDEDDADDADDADDEEEVAVENQVDEDDSDDDDDDSDDSDDDEDDSDDDDDDDDDEDDSDGEQEEDDDDDDDDDMYEAFRGLFGDDDDDDDDDVMSDISDDSDSDEDDDDDDDDGYDADDEDGD